MLLCTLIFATNNQHKADEIKSVVGTHVHIITLKEAGIDMEIPEPHDTLEANAKEKSFTIYKLTGADCFGEDTGLETEALNGEPGVLSARYAGTQKSPAENMQKLLYKLQGKANRSAQFRTIISLILNGTDYLFEGICKGNIIETPRGDRGFGYDPVFMPDGSNKTFAEMHMTEKNKYSHRRKAIDKLIVSLNSLHP